MAIPSSAAKTLCTSFVLLFLFFNLSNVEGIRIQRSTTAAQQQQDINVEGKQSLVDGEEFEVDYTPPRTHPPKKPPPANNYQDGEDVDDQINVDYTPPHTHPPRSPPTNVDSDNNEDEIGAADYPPPHSHPPKSPPTNA